MTRLALLLIACALLPGCLTARLYRALDEEVHPRPRVTQWAEPTGAAVEVLPDGVLCVSIAYDDASTLRYHASPPERDEPEVLELVPALGRVQAHWEHPPGEPLANLGSLEAMTSRPLAWGYAWDPQTRTVALRGEWVRLELRAHREPIAFAPQPASGARSARRSKGRATRRGMERSEAGGPSRWGGASPGRPWATRQPARRAQATQARPQRGERVEASTPPLDALARRQRPTFRRRPRASAGPPPRSPRGGPSPRG